MTAEGLIVSGADDGTVRVSDPHQPSLTSQQIARHAGAVGVLAVTPNGAVVSGGADGVVRLSSPRRPDGLGVRIAQHEAAPEHMFDDPSFSSNFGVTALAVTDKGLVISGGGDGTVLRTRCLACVSLDRLLEDPIAPASAYFH